LQELHSLAAMTAERLYAKQLPTHYGILAYHYEKAHQLGHATAVESARHYLRKAGFQAWDNFENTAAESYFSRALALTPSNETRTRYELHLAREKVYDRQGNRAAQQTDLKELVRLANSLALTEQITINLRQAHYANMTSDYAHAINWSQTAVEQAIKGNSLEKAVTGYQAWSEALWQQGNYPAAQTQLQTGLQWASRLGIRQGIADCLNSLGIVAKNQGNFADAIAYYEQALAVRRELADQYGEAQTLNNIGIVTWQQGDYARTVTYLTKALIIWRAIGDRRGVGITLNNLGLLLDNQGDYVEASAHYEQALAIHREVGDRRGEGITLGNLGLMACNQGDYVKTASYYDQALTIRREIGDRGGEGITLGNLGLVAYNQGDYAKAAGYYKQALAIRYEIGDQRGKGICLSALGAVAIAQEQMPLAANYFQQSLAIRQELGQSQSIVEDWAGLAKVALAQGDLTGSREYAQQILEYLKKNPRLTGVENIMRTFWLTWEVLGALGQTVDTRRVLSLAVQIIQSYLDKNPDPAGQTMYLAQPYHHRLWTAWQSAQSQP